MRPPDAAILAVLHTLLRATEDHRTPVILRTRDPAQADALAGWLARAHGSRRTVHADLRTPAEIEVRLPRRMAWPEPGGRSATLPVPVSSRHLSGMTHPLPPDGTP